MATVDLRVVLALMLDSRLGQHAIGRPRDLHAGTASMRRQCELRVQSRRAIDVEGKGRWMDNVSIEGLWRSVKHAELGEYAYFSTCTPAQPQSLFGSPKKPHGYPGKNVSIVGRKADFGVYVMLARIASVSDRKITLADEFNEWTFLDRDDPELNGIPLGGLSGSPAFVVRNNTFAFAGIVTDCSDCEPPQRQIISISRLHWLNPDGSLDHAAIPW